MKIMLSLIERAYIYDLFSDIFMYKWKEEDYTQLITKLRDLGKDYPYSKDILEKLLIVKRRDVLIEYSTLFLSGIGSRPLVPIESKRFFSLLGEKIAIAKLNDLLSFYRSWGLRLKVGDFFQPEVDHISTVLGFMSFLIYKEHEYELRGKEPFRSVSDQKNFFASHILSWIPDWINDVVNDNRADIYKVVCKELDKWIKEDKDFLGV